MAILVKSTTAASDKNRWGTQWECFWDAQALYGREFQLDVAAEPETAKVNRFYTSGDWIDRSRAAGAFVTNPKATIVGFDALSHDWEHDWWCNPPFDLKREFAAHAAKQARQNGFSGMMLLPYEPLTGWWLELIEGVAAAVYEPDGRYNFVEPDGVTKKTGVNFGSVPVLFTPGYFPTTQRIRYRRGVRDELMINLGENLSMEPCKPEQAVDPLKEREAA
ncbi:hypothetical protein BZJ19_10115 [Salinivibrio proteolyticus]|nr:hypothetical protein BZJ19_10115 [Salinivibrio proteolyticus]